MEDVTNVAAVCGTPFVIVDEFRSVCGPAYEKIQNQIVKIVLIDVLGRMK